MEEMLDAFDENEKFLKIMPRSYFHTGTPEFFYRAAWIWVVNDEGKILVQRHSPLKKSYPNKWDMSVAGHVKAGETPLEAAVRETGEEIGIQASAEEFEFAAKYVEDDVPRFSYAFVLQKNVAIEELKLQEEEVAEVKWMTLEELGELVKTENYCAWSDALKDFTLSILKPYCKKR